MHDNIDFIRADSIALPILEWLLLARDWQCTRSTVRLGNWVYATAITSCYGTPRTAAVYAYWLYRSSLYSRTGSAVLTYNIVNIYGGRDSPTDMSCCAESLFSTPTGYIICQCRRKIDTIMGGMLGRFRGVGQIGLPLNHAAEHNEA